MTISGRSNSARLVLMTEALEHAPVRVIGRYALYGEIASGGMATVHFGRLIGPVGFSRTVAVKRLHPQYAKDPEFVSMFLDEARVAARIQHPNVVPTLDVVAMEGELFLVMEYIEGESLARILRALRADRIRIPPRIVGSIVSNILYGLHAAHEAKSERSEALEIVHRDVSPQNVLVGVDGAARVLDFGVAKASGRVQTTREGQIKGKLAYMPPEQLAGDKVDRRVDIYAASVVLWEALTAQRLFDGENEAVVLQKVLTGEIVPPSQIVPGLPPAVDEIVLRGVARNPNHRFATAHEMAVALEETLGIESPRKVGEFVASIAGDAIARRAATVKEIESVSSDITMGSAVTLVEGNLRATAQGARYAAAPPSSPDNSQLTRMSSVSISASGPSFPPQKRRGWLYAAIALGIIGVLGTTILVTRPATPEAGAQPPMVTPPPQRVSVSEPSGEPSIEPAASAAPVASTSASAAPTVALQPTGRLPPRVQPGIPRTGDPGTPQPKPNCEPPYRIEGGIRKIKKECM